MRAELSRVPGRDAFLLDMVSGILDAIQRRDTSHRLFHGCIDWHSSVHGHWALLRICRATGSGWDAARTVGDRLTPEGIALEHADLARRPEFEMPYGRAWFLRLAVEAERWAHVAPPALRALRAMADAVASSLVDALASRTPDPSTREYANHSWALVRLHDYLAHARRESDRVAVEDLVRRHCLGPEPSLFLAEDAASPEFFSRWGNWAYCVARVLGSDALAGFLRLHPAPDAELEPIATLLPAAHHLGMNWSRAWALRALSALAPDAADRARFDAAFIAHVETARAHHRIHAGRYGAYGHWVPQFAVYALTEGDPD